MPFPPRGRPSNSWWRSWTECCCLSLTRWVPHTFAHPLPPMKPHTHHSHACSNQGAHEGFRPLLSRCLKCGERDLGFMNSKQQKQPTHTVFGYSVPNCSNFRALNSNPGSLKEHTKFNFHSCLQSQIKPVGGFIFSETPTFLLFPNFFSLLSTWTCRHPLSSTPHHVRTRPALALLTTTQFLPTMPCPPTLASWATRTCAPR